MDIVADLRDLSQNLASGDSMEAALDAAGLIPLLGKAGDGAKVVKIILKYLKKFPAKAAELSKVMTRVVLKHAPLDSSRAYKAMAYDDAVARLKANGLADGDIEQLVGKLDEGESLEDVVAATKHGDTVVYLSKSRLKHILDRHARGVENPGRYTSFSPTGKTISEAPNTQPPRSSHELPDRMTETDIEEAILETVRNPTAVRTTHDGDTIEFVVSDFDKYGIDEMVVWIQPTRKSDGGKIKSAFPTEGPDVDTWTGSKWDAEP